MKKLIIAEKPSVAATICKALNGQSWQKVIVNQKARSGYYEGTDYVVTYCYGHMLGLFDLDDYFKRENTYWNLEELPFNPPNNSYKYKVTENTKLQLKVIVDLIKRNDMDTIINCGDTDIEGCVLGTNVIEYAFSILKINKPVKRLWLTETTEENIRYQLKNMKDNSDYRNYYEQGIARADSDLCIGINYTRALSLIASRTDNSIIYI